MRTASALVVLASLAVLAPQALPSGGDLRAYISTDYKTTVVLTRCPNERVCARDFWHSTQEITEAEKNTPPHYTITVTQLSG